MCNMWVLKLPVFVAIMCRLCFQSFMHVTHDRQLLACICNLFFIGAIIVVIEPLFCRHHWMQVLAYDSAHWIGLHEYVNSYSRQNHDDIVIWNRFPNYWPFVRAVDSRHKGPVTWSSNVAVMLAWTSRWWNSRVACDLKRHDAHVSSPFW